MFVFNLDPHVSVGGSICLMLNCSQAFPPSINMPGLIFGDKFQRTCGEARTPYVGTLLADINVLNLAGR